MTDQRGPILLADDDQDDIDMLYEVLMAADPEVHILIARSGKAAVKILLNPPGLIAPRLIVLDYNIPDLTGAQILALIKSDVRYKETPKVIWSTSDATAYEQICRKEGATHYFKKPDNINGVKVLARQLLSL